MPSFDVDGTVVITCEFCGAETGPQDDDSIFSVGLNGREDEFCCGECVHRMGLGGELILPCGLCQFPVLGTPEMIDGHDWEYCSHCKKLLTKAGIVGVSFGKKCPKKHFYDY